MAKTTTAAAVLKQLESLGSQIEEAVNELKEEKRTITAEMNAKLKEIDAKIDPLNEAYHRATGKWLIKPEDGKESSGDKRSRRGDDVMDALSDAIYAFISGKKDGASKAEISDHLPGRIKATDSIPDILDRLHKGHFEVLGDSKKLRRYKA